MYNNDYILLTLLSQQNFYFCAAKIEMSPFGQNRNVPFYIFHMHEFYFIYLVICSKRYSGLTQKIRCDLIDSMDLGIESNQVNIWSLHLFGQFFVVCEGATGLIFDGKLLFPSKIRPFD